MPLVLCALLLALSAPLVAQPLRQAHASHASNEPPIARRALDASQELMKAWRMEWMRGYRSDGRNPRRSDAGHCHYDGSEGHAPINIVRSDTRKSMCPTWYPAALEADERDGIDLALRGEARTRIRARRAVVLAMLDTALEATPDHFVLHGQRVRFAVDQRDSARARLAVQECRGSDGWCELLAVFVAAKFGALDVADSLVDVALGAMSPAERCTWTDVGALLDPAERRAYERHDCAERLAVERVLWWLADPFWSRARNERRAEHIARQVEVTLHSQLEIDERFDWRRARGGEAFSQLVVRYGWPSFVGWLGYAEDEGHRSWLGFDDRAVTTPSPEYTTPRSHVVPPWHTVLDPTSLARDDWRDMSPRWSRRQWDAKWWAQEHMKLGDAPIARMTDQVAFFRRAQTALVAVATQLTDPAGRTTAGVPYNASLVVSANPDSAAVIGRRLPAGQRVAISAPVAEASILSFEVLPAKGTSGAMGRSRFAVKPPPSLSKLAGRIALSDLALFDATTDAPHPATVSELLNVMLPTATAQRGGRIGVFWEAYGVQPGEPLDVRVRVQRDDRGFLKGIAVMAGLASSAKPAVEISWREPQAGLTGEAFHDAGIPVQSRAIALGLGALEPGRYTISVTITPAGAPPAASTRSLEIAR